MAQFVKVGSRTEFEDLEGGKLVEAGGHRIAVFNLGKSRMRKRARTDLCGGRPAMVVPTATVGTLPIISGRGPTGIGELLIGWIMGPRRELMAGSWDSHL